MRLEKPKTCATQPSRTVWQTPWEESCRHCDQKPLSVAGNQETTAFRECGCCIFGVQEDAKLNLKKNASIHHNILVHYPSCLLQVMWLVSHASPQGPNSLTGTGTLDLRQIVFDVLLFLHLSRENYRQGTRCLSTLAALLESLGLVPSTRWLTIFCKPRLAI